MGNAKATGNRQHMCTQQPNTCAHNNTQSLEAALRTHSTIRSRSLACGCKQVRMGSYRIRAPNHCRVPHRICAEWTIVHAGAAAALYPRPTVRPLSAQSLSPRPQRLDSATTTARSGRATPTCALALIRQGQRSVRKRRHEEHMGGQSQTNCACHACVFIPAAHNVSHVLSPKGIADNNMCYERGGRVLCWICRRLLCTHNA